MNARSRNARQEFTIDQANASLPLVRAITADMVQLSRELADRRERLSQLSDRERSSRGPYSDEVIQIEEQLAVDSDRLEEFATELREIGVEPCDVATGLVGFPHQMDGRLVYLSWKPGEPEVLFWHEQKGGERQPLIAGSCADGDAPGDELSNS